MGESSTLNQRRAIPNIIRAILKVIVTYRIGLYIYYGCPCTTIASIRIPCVVLKEQGMAQLFNKLTNVLCVRPIYSEQDYSCCIGYI